MHTSLKHKIVTPMHLYALEVVLNPRNIAFFEMKYTAITLNSKSITTVA